MEETLFTKIIRGEIPCHKIYEDALTFAFLDIHPKQPGHVLVVPKEQVDHLWDLSDENYAALMATVKKVGQRIRDVLQPARVALQVEGTGVPHAHAHVFPFNTVAEFHVERDQNEEPDHPALAAMAKKLAF